MKKGRKNIFPWTLDLSKKDGSIQAFDPWDEIAKS